MSTPPAPATDPAGNPPAPGPAPAAPPAPAVPATPPAPAPGAPPAGDGDPALGPEGEKALTEWKKRAKEAEQREKEQAARLKEFEDRDKTDAEKQAEALKAATERADQATRLAVSSQVEALAAGRFQDPQDAVTALQSGTFVTADGTVDRAAITAALDNLLTQKPHWAPSGPLTPRPDPSQGPRPGGTAGGVEDQIAAAKAKGDWRTVLSLENAKLANVKN
ncbi:hypothetical protein [Streptomyces sp. AK08-02]|uniref:hypothetical protein n=1 Tax=Streptomyces sp. AK08-02 TaxID=3028654 RepID=UPI0029A63A9B|nr:hypothetical protein [Streptomyces sp. AK08-02]MDX3747459.1 hypothetical protein [Streptomyces sp. AK08-02]